MRGGRAPARAARAALHPPLSVATAQIHLSLMDGTEKQHFVPQLLPREFADARTPLCLWQGGAMYHSLPARATPCTKSNSYPSRASTARMVLARTSSAYSRHMRDPPWRRSAVCKTHSRLACSRSGESFAVVCLLRGRRLRGCEAGYEDDPALRNPNRPRVEVEMYGDVIHT